MVGRIEYAAAELVDCFLQRVFRRKVASHLQKRCGESVLLLFECPVIASSGTTTRCQVVEQPLTERWRQYEG